MKTTPVKALRVYVRTAPTKEWKPAGTITPDQQSRNEQAWRRMGFVARYVEVQCK